MNKERFLQALKEKLMASEPEPLQDLQEALQKRLIVAKRQFKGKHYVKRFTAQELSLLQAFLAKLPASLANDGQRFLHDEEGKLWAMGYSLTLPAGQQLKRWRSSDTDKALWQEMAHKLTVFANRPVRLGELSLASLQLGLFRERQR